MNTIAPHDKQTRAMDRDESLPVICPTIIAMDQVLVELLKTWLAKRNPKPEEA